MHGPVETDNKKDFPPLPRALPPESKLADAVAASSGSADRCPTWPGELGSVLVGWHLFVTKRMITICVAVDKRARHNGRLLETLQMRKSAHSVAGPCIFFKEFPRNSVAN